MSPHNSMQRTSIIRLASHTIDLLLDQRRLISAKLYDILQAICRSLQHNRMRFIGSPSNQHVAILHHPITTIDHLWHTCANIAHSPMNQEWRLQRNMFKIESPRQHPVLCIKAQPSRLRHKVLRRNSTAIFPCHRTLHIEIKGGLIRRYIRQRRRPVFHHMIVLQRHPAYSRPIRNRLNRTRARSLVTTIDVAR